MYKLYTNMIEIISEFVVVHNYIFSFH